MKENMNKLKGASAFSIPTPYPFLSSQELPHLLRPKVAPEERPLGFITLKESGILFPNFPRAPQSHERLLLSGIDDLTHS